MVATLVGGSSADGGITELDRRCAATASPVGVAAVAPMNCAGVVQPGQAHRDVERAAATWASIGDALDSVDRIRQLL